MTVLLFTDLLFTPCVGSFFPAKIKSNTTAFQVLHQQQEGTACLASPPLCLRHWQVTIHVALTPLGYGVGGWICMRLSSFSQSVLLITKCIHCQIMGQDKLNSPLRKSWTRGPELASHVDRHCHHLSCI